MRVELVGFSQGVSLANKDEHQNYLDFRTGTGKEFRLPVSEEAMNALLAQVYDPQLPQEPPADEGSVEEDVEDPDATVFGDGEPPDDNGPTPEEEETMQVEADLRRSRRGSIPAKEEDVPSL